MSKNNKQKRSTIRKRKIRPTELFFTCLYGSKFASRFVKAYCNLHECYLSAENIKEKGCNKKKCKYLKEIDITKQPK